MSKYMYNSLSGQGLICHVSIDTSVSLITISFQLETAAFKGR